MIKTGVTSIKSSLLRARYLNPQEQNANYGKMVFWFFVFVNVIYKLKL